MDNPDLLIRRGTVADAAELAAFAARTFAETYGDHNHPEDMRAHLESSFSVAQQTSELADRTVAILLAYDDATLIAFAHIRHHAPPPCVTQPHAVELHRYYVDRPAHGRGVAQRLMAATFASARELGGQHLWLSVWDQNPRAIAFYKKMSFVDAGGAEFILGNDRQTDRVLVAALGPTGGTHTPADSSP